MFISAKPAARQRFSAQRSARACAALLALVGTAAGADTLSEIYLQARANDPIFGAATATAAAGREKEYQARAGLLPTVTASATIQRDLEHASYIDGKRRIYSNRPWNVTVNQPLFRLANMRAYDQGVLQSQLADQQLRLAEQDLLLRVAKAYFDVLQAQDALAAMTAQRDAFAQQLAQSKRSFDVGLSSITDLNESQARNDLGIAQEIGARNDLEVKRRTLEKLIGRELPPLAAVDPEAGVNVVGDSQAERLVERAPSDSLQVAAGETAEQVAKLEIDRQHASRAPTIDLVLNANERNSTAYVSPGNSRNYTAGLEIQIPVFQGGAVDSRTREAVANLERTRRAAERPRPGQARRAPGLPRRAVGCGALQLAAPGPGLGRDPGQVDDARLRGRHAHAGRRAERPATALRHPQGPVRRPLPDADGRPAAQGRRRGAERGGPARPGRADGAPHHALTPPRPRVFPAGAVFRAPWAPANVRVTLLPIPCPRCLPRRPPPLPTPGRPWPAPAPATSSPRPGWPCSARPCCRRAPAWC